MSCFLIKKGFKKTAERGKISLWRNEKIPAYYISVGQNVASLFHIHTKEAIKQIDLNNESMNVLIEKMLEHKENLK